jgi:hypothetical protein
MRFAEGLLRSSVDWRAPRAFFSGRHFFMNQGMLRIVLDGFPLLFFIGVLIFESKASPSGFGTFPRFAGKERTCRHTKILRHDRS